MNATAVLFDIDGVPTPAADCDWTLVGPCGCVFGLCVVLRRGQVIADEDTALRMFEPYNRDKLIKDGFTVQIAKRDAAVADFRKPCQHTDGES